MEKISLSVAPQQLKSNYSSLKTTPNFLPSAKSGNYIKPGTLSYPEFGRVLSESARRDFLPRAGAHQHHLLLKQKAPQLFNTLTKKNSVRSHNAWKAPMMWSARSEQEPVSNWGHDGVKSINCSKEPHIYTGFFRQTHRWDEPVHDDNLIHRRGGVSHWDRNFRTETFKLPFQQLQLPWQCSF